MRITPPWPKRVAPDSYTSALERYAALGVDTEAALETLRSVPVSLHCWQGDDVGGFEKAEPGFPAAASRAPAIIPAKHAPSQSCGKISTWRSP